MELRKSVFRMTLINTDVKITVDFHLVSTENSNDKLQCVVQLLKENNTIKTYFQLNEEMLDDFISFLQREVNKQVPVGITEYFHHLKGYDILVIPTVAIQNLLRLICLFRFLLQPVHQGDKNQFVVSILGHMLLRLSENHVNLTLRDHRAFRNHISQLKKPEDFCNQKVQEFLNDIYKQQYLIKEQHRVLDCFRLAKSLNLQSQRLQLQVKQKFCSLIFKHSEIDPVLYNYVRILLNNNRICCRWRFYPMR